MLIQIIRDEAHRFAISFHRQKRSKATFTTQLEDIPGIGKKTADKLLAHFKSWKKVKEATAEELENVVGRNTSEKILAYLNGASSVPLTGKEKSDDMG
jgi:excinuclease ABC subunit C